MSEHEDKAIEAAAKEVMHVCPDSVVAEEVARNTIAAYEREMWRPIEEAPRASECEDVLVIGGRYTEPTVVPSDGAWWALQKSNGNTAVPTHFRPLPPVPEGE